MNFYTNASKIRNSTKLKAGNTSENLLNEIHQTIHSLYQVNKITKQVYNNIMNSIQL